MVKACDAPASSRPAVIYLSIRPRFPTKPPLLTRMYPSPTGEGNWSTPHAVLQLKREKDTMRKHHVCLAVLLGLILLLTPSVAPEPEDVTADEDAAIDVLTTDDAEVDSTVPANTNTSDLWGVNGELWSPSSRLPDYSFAGYHSSDRAIPTLLETANVRNFGAVGNGIADDTAAFRMALAHTSSGAIYIPPGRYRIRDILELTTPNTVLRGAGGTTILYFDKSLREILGTPPGEPYRHGLLRIVGQKNGNKLANVTANQNRGQKTLSLSSTSRIRVGRYIRLRMKNPPDNSLGCYLYAERGCLNSERRSWPIEHQVDWVVQVKSISGNQITLERPLRLDVRTNWSPEIWSFQPTVQESGIENLTIEFPNVQYAGHDNEEGFHGIQLEGVFHCWVKNVTIVDTDRGINLKESGFNTVTGVTLKTRHRVVGADPHGATGHYGFSVEGPSAQDNLFTNSRLLTVYVHNMAVAVFANGNVYSNITSKTARFDNHGSAPYENLYTNILLTTNGNDFFRSGGVRKDEPNSTRTTAWNIRLQKGIFGGFTSADKLPQANIVGVNALATKKSAHTSTEWWIEKWPGEDTLPLNLHAAQLQKRRQ
jgi:hypothetical protein